MSDTPRDRDARAAMREILRGLVMGDIDRPMKPAELAHDVWNYADAMAAERRKREAAEAPAPTPDLASLQAELAKLRAVAEAAAALVDGMGGDDALDLRADVKRALAGWRTAP